MTALSADLAVVGAGALGLSIALECQDQGLDVLLIDEGAPVSASSAAAGMTAPVMETLTDPPTGNQVLELIRAAHLWPGFAKRFGLSHRQTGGLWLAPESARADAEEKAALFRSCGLPLEAVSTAEARSLAAWLDPDPAARIYHAPLEGAIAPGLGLSELGAAFEARGGRRITGLAHVEREGLTLEQAPIASRWTVVAGGYGSSSLASLAPELQALVPIRGQIAHFEAIPTIGSGDPFVRGPGAYVAPQSDGGVRVGATMEMGETSLDPDPAVIERLTAAAARFAPCLGGRTFTGRAALRASTPDDRPFIGPSRTPGVFLATGVRRNGWLLAPLAAEIIVAQIRGRTPPDEALRLDPRRAF